MNEQRLADLFSEQIDRLLQDQPPDVMPDDVDSSDELQELLELGSQISQTQFQASDAAQVTFQSQLKRWFDLTNGGFSMTILALSKVWLISIVITIITVVTGTGIIKTITGDMMVRAFQDKILIQPVVDTNGHIGMFKWDTAGWQINVDIIDFIAYGYLPVTSEFIRYFTI